MTAATNIASISLVSPNLRESSRSASNVTTQATDGHQDKAGDSAPTNSSERREQSQLNSELQRLRVRDRAVRAHELAHSTVGGKYAGAASLTYERGPDGVLYATGGEVPIDVSAVPGDPQATIEKMRVVRNAALAPLNPSAVDRVVAAQASARAAKASAELAKLSAEESDTRGSQVDLLA